MWRGWSGVTVDEDLGGLMSGASNLRLETLEPEIPRELKDLKVVEYGSRLRTPSG